MTSRNLSLVIFFRQRKRGNPFKPSAQLQCEGANARISVTLVPTQAHTPSPFESYMFRLNLSSPSQLGCISGDVVKVAGSTPDKPGMEIEIRELIGQLMTLGRWETWWYAPESNLVIIPHMVEERTSVCGPVKWVSNSVPHHTWPVLAWLHLFKSPSGLTNTATNT